MVPQLIRKLVTQYCAFVLQSDVIIILLQTLSEFVNGQKHLLEQVGGLVIATTENESGPVEIWILILDAVLIELPCHLLSC